jgi:methylenetetrahydrofolate reductase (NADPH)
VPIIPGLKPITTLKHIAFLPKTFRVDLPNDFAAELVQCRTDADVRKVGEEWSVAQSRELIARGAPCLHFYTMGRSEAVRAIVGKVF